jgi:hypothetical protein
VVSVQEWAEIRRMRFVEGLAIREIRRRTGLHRETIRRALRSPVPPRFSRSAGSSRLDGFREQIHELLRGDPRIETQRILELLAEQGYEGGRSITYEYVREVRPFFVDQRTYQRTVYRPGDVIQFDLWQPEREIAVGYGQTRKGYVVVGALGYSRFGAGALVFSKEAPDVLWGMWRCMERIGALPARLVVDREGCLHAGGGKPSDEFAGFCGQSDRAESAVAPLFRNVLGVDPSSSALADLRMEQVFADVFYDFGEAPTDRDVVRAYIDLVDLYLRVLRETTNWLARLARRLSTSCALSSSASGPGRLTCSAVWTA